MSDKTLQTKFSPLSKEIADQATINKTEMLMIALNCYNQAEACAQESGNKEEKWLLHYMLGKIAEKLDQDPNIYLEHYKKVRILSKCFLWVRNVFIHSGFFHGASSTMFPQIF